MNLHLHLYGKLKIRLGRTIGNSAMGDRASVGRMIRHHALEWGGGELPKV
jgi:phosphoribosylaminoimidazole carboxylase (NCAIR synthetase)